MALGWWPGWRLRPPPGLRGPERGPQTSCISLSREKSLGPSHPEPEPALCTREVPALRRGEGRAGRGAQLRRAEAAPAELTS